MYFYFQTFNVELIHLGGLSKRRGFVDVFKNTQPLSTGPANIPPMMAPMMPIPSANVPQTNFMIPGKIVPHLAIQHLEKGSGLIISQYTVIFIY